MGIHRLTPTLGAVLLAVLVAGGLCAQDDDPGMVCADCHDDVAAALVLTPHGSARADAPSCESCHEGGREHMEEGDPDLVQVPRGHAGAGRCQACHAGNHSAFQGGAVHARAGVDCSDCHRIHPEGAPAEHLLRAPATDLCADCHGRQARTFSRPFGHRLGRAGLDCVSCHNPHGGPGDRSLKVDRSGDEVCVSCHAELRGPFVFPHVNGVTGGCVSCHEPHGSSNPNALKRARADQLCLECHSRTTAGQIGAQTPSNHDTFTPRYRNCTVCHVAVHGSNTSPTLQK